MKLANLIKLMGLISLLALLSACGLLLGRPTSIYPMPMRSVPIYPLLIHHDHGHLNVNNISHENQRQHHNYSRKRRSYSVDY